MKFESDDNTKLWGKNKNTYSPHHPLCSISPRNIEKQCARLLPMCKRNNVLGARSPSSAMETMADGEDGGKKEHKYYNNHHQYYAFSIYKVWCQSEYS